MIKLLVDFDPDESGGREGRRIAVVSGEPTDSFRSRLVERFGYEGTSAIQVVIYDRHGVLVQWAVVDDEVTVEEAKRFADGEVIAADVLGRGGGDIWALITFVRAGYSIAKLLRQAADHLAAGHHVTERVLARDWMDSGGGNPSMQLRQAVNRERRWERGEFDLVFGLDAEPGGRLLRACGYRKITNVPDVWVDEKE